MFYTVGGYSPFLVPCGTSTREEPSSDILLLRVATTTVRIFELPVDRTTITIEPPS